MEKSKVKRVIKTSGGSGGIVDSLIVKFGALVEPIDIQLKNQGINFSDMAEIREIQKDADAITRLSVRQLLAPSELTLARGRLLNDLKQFLRENLGD